VRGLVSILGSKVGQKIESSKSAATASRSTRRARFPSNAAPVAGRAASLRFVWHVLAARALVRYLPPAPCK
jgi:hypothetical protein